ncbi:MAG TPA: NFACT RNA binding domain-containing protein [Pyrinomonadaceae bacterium]|nr:NFACT RNA binding domain-containing protein [Pyrinomonadaceae bacterium]
MNQSVISRVVEELRADLTGRFFGKIFQLTPLSFAFDFGLRGHFLFVSVDPSSPRLYLIQRRLRDLEKQSVPLTAFAQAMRSKLAGAHVLNISQDHADRIVRFSFRIDDEAQGVIFRRLVVQLTGRTADLFVLDELNRTVAVLRDQTQERLHQTYQPPPRSQKQSPESLSIGPGPPSSQLDEHFTALEKARVFDSRAKGIRSKLTKSIRQQHTLREHLQDDLRRHGNPEEHKKIGDLLLANISTAVRNGNKVRISDYYAEGAPALEVEVDQNRSLQEEAAHRFRQYTKAKRATEEIAARLAQIELETARLETRVRELDQIIALRDETALETFEKPAPAPKVSPKKSSKPEKIPGVRRYLSTDGYEILVGRGARDNDHLTFRVAQPNDLWMHAGDYPGSHVVVRNPARKEIPHRTIIEAAQLAGRFSQASEDTKVVIHYTERKFLSKPKGAAPGLVRLSRFRSIAVEPKEGVNRLGT